MGVMLHVCLPPKAAGILSQSIRTLILGCSQLQKEKGHCIMIIGVILAASSRGKAHWALFSALTPQLFVAEQEVSGTWPITEMGYLGFVPGWGGG